MERTFVFPTATIGDTISACTCHVDKEWSGGTLVFRPSDADLKPYELPVEKFFHKIVMVRDRFRVEEQLINSSALGDEEKVGLQQYITGIYGSLTSFNVLYGTKQAGFTGQK